MATNDNNKTKIQRILFRNERKKLTLVVLGESGVGKTSWINSFVNFLNSDTYETAFDNDKLFYLIPAKFQYEKQKPKKSFFEDSSNSAEETTKAPEKVDITIGEVHANENPNFGESCTQEPFSHHIKFSGDVEVTIIDTPGVGDTRGDKQNKNNITMVLNHLGNYEKVDAFVILLKPECTRLKPEFENCIRLLFSQLNRSAADNVVFGFTYSKNTHFKATDTKQILHKLFEKIETSFKLEENRCFFLIALHSVI